MVSIKVEQEVVCALSNSDIADDLERPLSAPNHPHFLRFAPPFTASSRVNLETSNLVHLFAIVSPTLPMKNLP